MNFEQHYVIDPNGMIRWEEAMHVNDEGLLEAMRKNRLVHDIACNFAYMGIATGIA